MTITVSTQFEITPAQFAELPAEQRGVPRDSVKLLISSPQGIEHKKFIDLPSVLRSGDVLVVNDSAMINAAYDARVTRGARAGEQIVAHLASSSVGPILEARTAGTAESLIDDLSPGDQICVGEAELDIVTAYPKQGSPTGSGNRVWQTSLRGTLPTHEARPIAYGYLAGQVRLADYQTVFGQTPGSVEMPSASRPFTHQIVQKLSAMGVQIAPVTLHTAFSSQEASEPPLPEWRQVPGSTVEVVNTAREEGRRVIAVGTTTARALESSTSPGVPGLVAQTRGWTRHVIHEQNPAQVCSGLLTGWHDPQASHLALVESIAGPEVTQAAYSAASSNSYLWHEFGDVGLLLR